ncbi:MAG TPA: VCBS repeat-containing protein, partial [Chloroflexia bacterium]|nr:VCBS repeat-containing protein [Chloroflexia bacterium]
APCTSARTLSVLLGNGNSTFQPAREIDVGTGMHRMTAGDFNRDGIKDLAIGAENTRLYTLLGVGDGTFVQQPTIFLVPGGDLFSAGNDVAVGDFNRDALQDLAVPLGNGRGTAILIGRGDGTFGEPVRILDNAIDSPQSLAAADCNRDGFVDIARALGDGTRGLLDILHGNGDGTFQPAIRYLMPPPLSSVGGIVIISGDFNIDTRPDIALMVGGASPALKVLLNSSGAPPPLATATPLPTLPPGATATRTPTPLPTATRTPTRTPTAAAADTVSITRAEYSTGNRELRVEATSSNGSVVLRAYVSATNALIGTLSNNGGGRYEGRFSWPSNPQNVTVRSSAGGVATRAVTAR